MVWRPRLHCWHGWGPGLALPRSGKNNDLIHHRGGPEVEQNGTVKSELNSELNLDVAIERVHKNIISSCFPNRLDAAIIKHYPDKIKERVEGLLEDTSMNWANGSARFFDLPKSDKLVRPICYIDVDVAVAYQALVDAASSVIEPHIESAFGDRILSQRLREPLSPLMFQDPTGAFRNYINVQHKLAKSREYSYCLRLDIANYYERIYQHKLQQLLERRGVPGIVTTALWGLLRKFSGGDSHGIPQGLWASDYLGNSYLLYLDEFLDDKDDSLVKSHGRGNWKREIIGAGKVEERTLRSR